jgi:hypothetical protein
MYRGPSLAHLFDFEDDAKKLSHDLAREGGSRMTDNVRRLTPVGHRPFEPGYTPGHLLASIETKIVVVYFDTAIGAMVYESGSETNVDYAPYVENGTGLWGPTRAMYEIRPKNPDGWLRFHDEHGNVVFAKRVMHPGSPGAHMFVRGAALTDEQFREWADREVEGWCRERDAQISVRAREKVLVS